MIVVLKGSASSGWYSPPRGTHSGEKHRAIGSGKSKSGGKRTSRKGSRKHPVAVRITTRDVAKAKLARMRPDTREYSTSDDPVKVLRPYEPGSENFVGRGIGRKLGVRTLSIDSLRSTVGNLHRPGVMRYLNDLGDARIRPIAAVKDPRRNVYYMIDGHHRVAALELMGDTTVQVRVYEHSGGVNL